MITPRSGDSPVAGCSGVSVPSRLLRLRLPERRKAAWDSRYIPGTPGPIPASILLAGERLRERERERFPALCDPPRSPVNPVLGLGSTSGDTLVAGFERWTARARPSATRVSLLQTTPPHERDRQPKPVPQQNGVKSAAAPPFNDVSAREDDIDSPCILSLRCV